MLFYLSVTKKPQLDEIRTGTFMSAEFWLKAACFYCWGEGKILTDTFGHTAKTGLDTKYKV